MAANEIPIAGYGSTLSSRAEVAEGTMVLQEACEGRAEVRRVSDYPIQLSGC